MALLHRALVAWFVALVFLVLLVLQLDHRTQWSWFLVLHCSQDLRSRPWYFCRKFVTLMSPILLKITYQCLLCSRLDSPSSGIPLYYLFIPLWLLLSAAIVKLTRILVPVCRE